MTQLPDRAEVTVVGLGGIGTAALHHVARQGHKVLGLEQFRVGHDRGSSHGESRIFRVAYFEDPAYVPMALRSLEGWRELERTTDRELLVRSGGLDLGRPDGRLLPGSLRSCELHGLPHARWSARTVREKVPELRLPAGVEAVFQPDAGILRPEEGVRAHLDAARDGGAGVREGVTLVDWETEGSGIRLRVATEDGAEHELRTDRLILTTGAWLGRHLPTEARSVTVRPERQVVGWVPAPPGIASTGLPTTGAFPVVNADLDEGHVYLMPPFDGLGTKVGLYHHRHEDIADPDERDPAPDDRDRELLQALADRYLAGGGQIDRMRTCRFNLTPDEHFLIDTLAEGRVVVGGGFSGHGYKFAPALGEVLAALALDRPVPLPIDAFSLARFRGA